MRYENFSAVLLFNLWQYVFLTFIVCLGRGVFEELDNENVYISLDLEKLFDTLYLLPYSTRK